ncbi:MAG TPA: hypothetical protein VN811_02700 [Thermoanaerobaculia bacterium]|nr:hypothetical protein [Thermoanaerobaculia bacterium]
MAFTWQIHIHKVEGGGYAYDPPELDGVQVGDQIIWSNGDDVAHWPGLVDGSTTNPTYFMPNQIAPDSPSDTFVPGDPQSGQLTLTYVDTLDNNSAAPKGTIVVSAAS